MLPQPTGSAAERRLAKLYRSLSPADRDTLIAFAEFLVQRGRPEPGETMPREPKPTTRPDKETVVGAIKRLSQSYDMLERDSLLNETSALMSAHLLQGRGAAEVIDDLEALFARHYQDYLTTFAPQDRTGSA
ncbi:hypothetical protein [Imhoffiella purpurea]|uniref:Crp/Fnr family transcriptional regulator n=1 Tax=Imhoffiella purpurea TaxID=1249627 RepID=W9V7A1_9GAMM|nr:hypothetical protein [Imhoffiella purpurea]EXJ15284.1 hypothetical protein D779_1582 [Imhoffiella purpurea]